MGPRTTDDLAGRTLAKVLGPERMRCRRERVNDTSPNRRISHAGSHARLPGPVADPAEPTGQGDGPPLTAREIVFIKEAAKVAELSVQDFLRYSVMYMVSQVMSEVDTGDGEGGSEEEVAGSRSIEMLDLGRDIANLIRVYEGLGPNDLIPP